MQWRRCPVPKGRSREDLRLELERLRAEIRRLKIRERKFLDLEEEYRLYFERSRDVMVSLTPEGVVRSVTSGVEAILGYRPEELAGRRLDELGVLEPASLGRALTFLARAAEGGRLDSGKFEFIRRDGSRCVGDVSGVSVVSRGDETVIVMLGRDVTESVIARERLSEANERIGTLLQAIPDIVYFKDAAGRNISVNRAFERFAGRPREEIEGRTDREIFPPDFADQMIRSDVLVMGSGRTVQLEETFRCSDGTCVVFETIKEPIFDERGCVVGLAGVSRDVTGRHQAEKELKESEERYRTFVESASFGFAICAVPGGRFIHLNEAACRMFGYDMDRVDDLTVWDLIHPDEHAHLRGRMRAKESGRVPYSSTEIYTGLRRDGTFIRFRINAAPIPYLGTRVMQCILMDVTELEQLERQFQQAQRMEAVGTLAGGIAHDFNNLLMGILGNISLMLMTRGENDRDSERLRSMERYVLRGSDLTKRLLGFARGGKYETRSIDLGEFVQRSLEMFSQTRKELRVRFAAQEGLWAVEVDHGQMEQVLLNLFVNAWQAMPNGGDLSVECRNALLGAGEAGPERVMPGRFVSVTVRDTGIGMDRATRERIFDPFFTTKERGIGTGLGLASVYGIVKNHGGFITVESLKGRGSTFCVFLPATDKEPERETEEKAEIRAGAETVLLVDDEEPILEVGTDMLRSLGYRVLTSRSGEDALALYGERGREVDLVILDMIMPGMGGAKTYEGLKRMDPRVKVLLSSGYSLSGQAEGILEQGYNGFIQKPFTVHDLSLKIREILERG